MTGARVWHWNTSPLLSPIPPLPHPLLLGPKIWGWGWRQWGKVESNWIVGRCSPWRLGNTIGPAHYCLNAEKQIPTTYNGGNCWSRMLKLKGRAASVRKSGIGLVSTVVLLSPQAGGWEVPAGTFLQGEAPFLASKFPCTASQSLLPWE